MIDLHCHILPGLDDGPSELRGALQLARALADDGVEVVAATPHLRYDHPRVRPGELAFRCSNLREHLARAAIPLRLVGGGEVDLRWALDASDEDLRLVSYGQEGAYVLLETPYPPLSANFEELVFRALTARGFGVVLAHPERNPTLQGDPDRVVDLVRRGVLMQITAPALLHGDRRSRSGRLARTLLERGLAHLLASDAHSITAKRGPRLAAAVRVAARIAPRRARWMVTDAAAAVLAGEPLPNPPADGATARRWRLR